MALSTVEATFKTSDLLRLIQARIERAENTMSKIEAKMAPLRGTTAMHEESFTLLRDAYDKARGVAEHKFWIPILANCKDETVTVLHSELQWLRIDSLDVQTTLKK